MQAIQFKAKGAAEAARRHAMMILNALRRQPRLSALALAFIGTSLLLGVTVPDDSAGASRPAALRSATLPLSGQLIGPAGGTQREAAPPAGAPGEWIRYTVAAGDTLEAIFRRLGLGAGLLHQIVTLDAETRKLARLLPGQEIGVRLTAGGDFQALRVDRGSNWLTVEQGASGLAARQEERSMLPELRLVTGVVHQSLYQAGKDAGLSDALILNMANIFAWDLDLVYDLRDGDRFYVLYEEIRRDGAYLKDGEVLAAIFVNRGKVYQAVRFDAGEGPKYYTPEGKPMRKAFLRAPLNFLRVTSNFNPRRFHPVLKRVRAHNGVDYGAPVGTPVYAAGDGTVIAAAYGSANGNYVFIRHPNRIETRYLHLSRRTVKNGERVRQGQTIGLVGATGLANGPHLHYEFLVAGQHRNPRTIQLPAADPVPATRLADFRGHAGPLLAHLTSLQDPPPAMTAAAP